MSRSLLRFFIVFFLVFSITSCNFLIKQGYNYFDVLIIYRLNDYFELTKEQKIKLKQQLHLALKSHKETHLTNLINLLNKTKKTINNGISSTSYDELMVDFLDVREQHIDLITPMIIDLLSTVDDNQIQQISAKFNKNNQKRAKKTTPSHLKKKEKSRLNDYKNALGSLNKKQQQWVRNRIKYSQQFNQKGFLQTQFNQKKLIAVLKTKPNKQDVYSTVIQYLYTPTLWHEEHYKIALKENRQNAKSFYLRLLNSLNEAQLQQLNKTLDNYIDLLLSLKQ